MKQSELQSYFTPELFIPELKASTKDGVLKEMAAWLEAQKRVFRTALVYDLLHKREGLGSTGIAGGIAIPHCRTIAVQKLTVLCALKHAGVDFGAPDKKPVKIFFMVVAPPQDVTYLVFLGKLVEVVNDKQLKRALFEVTTFEEFITLVAGAA
jgi:mannitol/fructose-specific phosphotransferase system IIA component (Ntr-type)